MDSGLYPLGRKRVFAWSHPDGQVTIGNYDWTASRNDVLRDVPEMYSEMYPVIYPVIYPRGSSGSSRSRCATRAWSGSVDGPVQETHLSCWSTFAQCRAPMSGSWRPGCPTATSRGALCSASTKSATSLTSTGMPS